MTLPYFESLETNQKNRPCWAQREIDHVTQIYLGSGATLNVCCLAQTVFGAHVSYEASNAAPRYHSKTNFGEG
jgi:hypothetical protein